MKSCIPQQMASCGVTLKTLGTSALPGVREGMYDKPLRTTEDLLMSITVVMVHGGLIMLSVTVEVGKPMPVVLT